MCITDGIILQLPMHYFHPIIVNSPSQPCTMLPPKHLGKLIILKEYDCIVKTVSDHSYFSDSIGAPGQFIQQPHHDKIQFPQKVDGNSMKHVRISFEKPRIYDKKINITASTPQVVFRRKYERSFTRNQVRKYFQ